MGRSVIITAYLPLELADEVDRTAQAQGLSRSKLIATSLAKVLGPNDQAPSYPQGSR